MIVKFTDVNINTINLKSKYNLIETNSFQYQYLFVVIENCQISNSSTVLGSMFLLSHSAQTFNLTRFSMLNNVGQLLFIEPVEVSGI